MYQIIHDDLLSNLRKKNDFRLVERRLNIGKAIKQLKESGRIKMIDFLKESELKRSAINTLMQMGEMNTSRDRFVKICKALKVPSDELIRIARETAHYNCYRLDQNNTPRFKYKTHDVEVYSPPSYSRKDFMWCLIKIQPGKSIEGLIHDTINQIGGFVTNGHLKFTYGDKSYSIHTNQAFFFDPKTMHSFENHATTETTEFFVIYQLKPERKVKEETRGRKTGAAEISTSLLIEQIRKELSPDPDRLLPMPALSAMSGIDLNSLVHLSYRKTKIIPFEKIDLLANLTDYSFDHIIQKAENRYKGWVTVLTDQDKVLIDMSMRYGTRFTSHAGIGIGKRKFSIADMIFEPWKEGQHRKEWRYQGIGFIGISVQRGQIGIQYGNQPLQVLSWGTFLYLNANIEIAITNMLSEEKAREIGESPEAKVIFFSSPPVV